MQKMFSNRVLPEIDHRIYPLNGKANANDTCNAFCPTMQKTAYIHPKFVVVYLLDDV